MSGMDRGRGLRVSPRSCEVWVGDPGMLEWLEGWRYGATTVVLDWLAEGCRVAEHAGRRLTAGFGGREGRRPCIV